MNFVTTKQMILPVSCFGCSPFALVSCGTRKTLILSPKIALRIFTEIDTMYQTQSKIAADFLVVTLFYKILDHSCRRSVVEYRCFLERDSWPNGMESRHVCLPSGQLLDTYPMTRMPLFPLL